MDIELPEEAIREASEHLRKGSMLLRLSKNKSQPYPINKCVNMMGKTAYDNYTVLKVLLGDWKREDVTFETKIPATKLLDTYLAKENETSE